MPPFAARVEANLASVQSEAKERGKLRNEPLDRSTRLFVDLAASCENCTNEVRDQVVSSVAKTQKKTLPFSENSALAKHFSTWASHESARRNKTTQPGSYHKPHKQLL